MFPTVDQRLASQVRPSRCADDVDTKSSLVVIGAGMATFGFLRHLEQQGGLQHFNVTVIGEEPHPCYDRVNLTDGFARKSTDELLLAPHEWYANHGIRLLTGARVEGVDREQRVVITESGNTIGYQQLVLATGSRPFVPPIEGADLKGVFVYRTLQDMHQIRAYANERQAAAVLGGGLLGLEAAKALGDLQLAAHVIERNAGLMPRQLNIEAARLLQQQVEELGVAVHLERQIARIEARGERRVIHYQQHDPLEVDLVVISAGVRPRDELAIACGLPVGAGGGVVVDAQLRTDDPQIFAMGECVSLDGQRFGLVGPCYGMAEVLADNLLAERRGASERTSFNAPAHACRLKLMGIEVATLGAVIDETAEASLVVGQGAGFSRSLIIEQGRLVGAIGVGDWPERQRLSIAIAKRRRVGRFMLRRFRETGSLWPVVEREEVKDWPTSATICSCLNITRGQLTAAIRAGATDANALAASTGASTACGSCRPLLCALADATGTDTATEGLPPRFTGLFIPSLVALILTTAIVFAGPLPIAETVRSSWRQIDFLWTDSWARQTTGLLLLVVTLLGLTFSLRKRLSWLKLGKLSTWRGLHGVLGMSTLLAFLVHTGMRLGHNLTLALAVVFLALNLLGAVTGVATALENRFTGAWERRLRAWRPRLTQLHIWLFWPLPALVAFHIFSVYYY